MTTTKRSGASARKPAARRKASRNGGTKLLATPETQGNVPSFWDRFSEAYRSMCNDPRIEVIAPKRLAHAAPNARMLRSALAELDQNTGAKTDVFAPFAGHLFYTRLWWLGPKDASGLHPFGGEICLKGIGELQRPFAAAPGWAVFDDHPNAGDGVLSLIRAQEGQWELGVFEHGSVTKLDLDVPGYMQALLDLRGAFGWQWLYADAAAARKKKLSVLLDQVELYFATDITAYRARLR